MLPCDMLLTSGGRWLVVLNKGKRVPNGLSEIKQKRRVKQCWLQNHIRCIKHFSFAKSATMFPLLFALQHHSRNVLRNYSNQTHTGPYPAWIRGRLKWLKTIDVSHPLFCSQMCVLGKKWKRFSLNVFHSTYIFEIVAIFFVKSFSVYVNLNELKEPEWNRTARRSWEVAGLPFILTKYLTVLWSRQVLLVIFDR